MSINKKIYVSESSINGRGLFAACDLKRGEEAFEVVGKIVRMHPTTKEESMKYPDAIGLKDGLWIDPVPPFKYINHSCAPNLGMSGERSFVALRDIKKDEELTFDYSISEHSLWEMECNCGSASCRKVIRSIEYLPVDLFRSYFPYIPEYFQRIFLNRYILNSSKVEKDEEDIQGT